MSASSKPGARASTVPSSSITSEWPSKISSSWPPTVLQNATYADASRARVRNISSRSRSRSRWNGDAEMFTISSAPASARSVAGGPGCHMSSQIVTPIERVAVLEEVEAVARREVAELVEDAVVRQEALLHERLHLAARADGRGVVEVAVEVRRSDDGDDPARRASDLLERLLGGTHEAGAQQQILRRVAGDRELGEEDEVGACGSWPPRAARGSSRGCRRGRRRWD